MRAWSRPISWRIFAPTAASSASYGQLLPDGHVAGLLLGDDALAQVDVALDDDLLQAVRLVELRDRPPRAASPTPGARRRTPSGRQSRRSSATVDRLRANHVSAPTATAAKSLIMRSAMWLSGRNDSSRSPSPMSHQRHRALERPHDVGVADHRALGRAGRAARVDERGQLPGQHRVGARVEQIRARARAARRRSARSCAKPSTNGSSRRSSFVEHDDPVELGQLVLHLEDPAPRARGPRRSTRSPRCGRGCARPARASWSGTRAR